MAVASTQGKFSSMIRQVGETQEKNATLIWCACTEGKIASLIYVSKEYSKKICFVDIWQPEELKRKNMITVCFK